jgi:four helix bundle protein
MPEKSSFENLQVYKPAEELSDLVWGAVQRWDYFAKDTVGKQLVRSTDSVGANIAEGAGRGSIKDNIRFVKIARGSLFETKHWLRQSNKRNLLLETETKKFQETINTLLPKISAYLNSLSKKL